MTRKTIAIALGVAGVLAIAAAGPSWAADLTPDTQISRRTAPAPVRHRHALYASPKSWYYGPPAFFPGGASAYYTHYQSAYYYYGPPAFYRPYSTARYIPRHYRGYIR